MTTERVHFYSEYDMSISIYVERMEEVVKSYEDGKRPEDVNDYLEMFHIVQFVEHGKYPPNWDEKRIEGVKQYKGKIAAYFSQVHAEQLPDLYKKADRGYDSTIWQIIDQFKIKGVITEDVLRQSFGEDSWKLRDLLEYKWIVENHSALLLKLLKENKQTAEWLLDQYVADDRFGSHKNLFFPKSLSVKDKDAIVHDYVNSDDANLNYVRLALQAKRSPEFSLLPVTIKDARIKEQILNKKVLEQGCVHIASYGVTLTEKADAKPKERIVDEQGRTMFVYNKNLIDGCKDATIIYYCGIVFEFTDEFGFISLISKISEMDTMERIVGLNAKNAYLVSMAFRMGVDISHLQMLALQKVLKSTNRSVEKVIKVFYEDFLKAEYGYEGLPLTLPKDEDDLVLKIRSLAIEMDAVAHQYNCFVEYGSIDKDIIELTPPGKLTETKSLLSHRYCVQNKENNDVWYLIRLFFGDQSMLTYVEPCKDIHLRNFYQLLKKGINVRYADYQNYQKSDIDYLVDKGYLSKDEKGILWCEKMKEIEILKHLYEYGACSYWGYPKEGRKILDEMISKDWVRIDNHLLSPAERDYFSYFLNNEKFTNGPAIRNNYAHGTTPSYSENKHKHNYLQLLVLFIMLLLKISEDLDMKRYLGKYGLE